MTTVAYKDGIIAYDSRMTEGDMIVTDSFDKHKEVSGCHFFFSGRAEDYDLGIETYFSGQHQKAHCGMIVIDEGEVYSVSSGENDFEIIKVLWPYAHGSGTEFALAAMDMGANAKLAVSQAMKRDPFTGGRVRTFKV